MQSHFSESTSLQNVNKLKEAVRPVPKNNPVLGQTEDSTSQGNFEDRFLCAQVLDDDLLWDVKQIRW